MHHFGSDVFVNLVHPVYNLSQEYLDFFKFWQAANAVLVSVVFIIEIWLFWDPDHQQSTKTGEMQILQD